MSSLLERVRAKAIWAMAQAEHGGHMDDVKVVRLSDLENMLAEVRILPAHQCGDTGPGFTMVGSMAPDRPEPFWLCVQFEHETVELRMTRAQLECLHDHALALLDEDLPTPPPTRRTE